jgi:hypothetical protein
MWSVPAFGMDLGSCTEEMDLASCIEKEGANGAIRYLTKQVGAACETKSGYEELDQLARRYKAEQKILLHVLIRQQGLLGLCISEVAKECSKGNQAIQVGVGKIQEKNLREKILLLVNHREGI